MGSELVTSSTSRFSFSESFETACPQFMAMGMTYDEFWYGEPDRVKYYREAEEIRRKERDYNLWLQGRYVYDALCAASPILHAFAKNGTQAEPYKEEPYPRTMKEYKELQERQMKARAEEFKAFVEAKNRERRSKDG